MSLFNSGIPKFSYTTTINGKLVHVDSTNCIAAKQYSFGTVYKGKPIRGKDFPPIRQMPIPYVKCNYYGNNLSCLNKCSSPW